MRGGAQDLTVSETANDLSMGMWMWEKMGDQALSQYSMQWVRVFQPARFAVAAMVEKRSIAGILRPVASLADFAARRFLGGSIDKADEKPRKHKLECVEGAELTAVIRELSANYALRPDWSDSTLD